MPLLFTLHPLSFNMDSSRNAIDVTIKSFSKEFGAHSEIIKGNFVTVDFDGYFNAKLVAKTI